MDPKQGFQGELDCDAKGSRGGALHDGVWRPRRGCDVYLGRRTGSDGQEREAKVAAQRSAYAASASPTAV
jgi:hypothetical protein